jgi:predicted  nucleic acid-binding Zn-ribbon protein
MNKTLGTLITATLITIVGCTDNKTVTPEQTAQTAQTVQPSTEVVTPAIPSSDVNQFGTISSLDNSSVGGVEVICHNCQAHFKLSQQIQKMSLDGDAIVDCPVCHKNYLGK